jgi:hypothetical protein
MYDSVEENCMDSGKYLRILAISPKTCPKSVFYSQSQGYNLQLSITRLNPEEKRPVSRD